MHPLLLLLLIIFPSAHSVTGPHIADVNLLLPPRITHPVEYVLQGTDGCFSWSWDHHDILSVQPEFNATSLCSTSARLKSIAPYAGRKETAVYAADLNTGVVIRCKVFIDAISRIQIFHNSVKLDLDGLATLRVRAFDTQENEFSSLVGLQFMWQLMPEDNGEIHHLVHVPLKDSPLTDLDVQVKLEDSGVFSDLYVVKGVEIGQEIVAVYLMEPQLEHMKDKIVLTVAEAMSIDPPSPLYVIVGASVHYNLRIIRQNTQQAIALPSPHHRWSVVNSSVAQVDPFKGVAHAAKLGITTIYVEDTRVVGHVQLSSLHVVIPDTLWLYKLPLTAHGDPVEGVSATPSTNRWYLIVGQQYLVHMKVFSGGPGAHEIYLTTSDDVKLQYNTSAYWETLLVPDDISAKHGLQSSRVLKATSQGLGRLSASLAYHREHPERKEVLKAVQEIMVCNQVRFVLRKVDVSSDVIHVPWIPGVYQELDLRAAGGCVETATDYKWYSLDVTTVSISGSGVVQAKKPGQAIIKVVSVFDPMNYDEVVVKVSIPSSMVMLQNFAVETVVGTYLHAAVTLKASDGSYFHSCDSFNPNVKWNSRSESFKIINITREVSTFNMLLDVNGSTSLYTPPCAWTSIYAFSVGRAVIHATLSKDLQSSNVPSYGPNVLKASLTIASYRPLVVQQAGNGNQFGGYSLDLSTAEDDTEVRNLNEVYLVPGTELNVVLLGGPERWGEGVEFVENVEIFMEEGSHLNDGTLVNWVSSTISGLYRISCRTLGNFQVVFLRGNLVGDDHPLRALEKVELSLICSYPSSIVLLANERVNALDLIRSAAQADRSPERIRATVITVANGCTIRVAAVGIHKSGKAFANSSSLCLKWELSGCDGLAYWNSDGLQQPEASWEKFLILLNTSGLCTVRASVIGFSDTVTSHLYEKASSVLERKNVLTDAMHLQLVSSLKIFPDYLLLFFSLDAKANLSIAGGTCFVDAVVNDTQVVEVVQPPTGLQCLHLMLTPRGLGTALITINDMGLSPPLAASAVVQVADVDWIKIISQEEISLEDGSEKSFDILAGVRDGMVFDSSQYAYMNIHVHIKDPILEHVDMHVSSPGGKVMSVPSFVIRAKSIGITTLYVSARQRPGRKILSQTIKIEVYAPPRIHPDDIFLVPGASYVLTLKGGPTVGMSVKYYSMDDRTTEIHSSSGRLLTISPGNTTVRAIVYGSGDTMICEAQGIVRVGIPSSMILNLQSEQLSIGREMSVFPSVAEGNLFSFYELCKNYIWSIEDEQVLVFKRARPSNGNKHEIHLSGEKETRRHGYQDEKDLGFINLVHGRSAGRTTIVVSFSCNFVSSGTSQSRSYNASASLWVVSDPPLALGVPITWVLPPFYTTSNLLPASSEPNSQWDSYNRKGTVMYSLLRTCGGKNEEIQDDSISIEGDRIRTMESETLACIMTNDRTTGRAEIASCVRVAEVTQIRLDAELFLFHVVDIAVGFELELIIKYYDSLGNPFHEAYDVVQISAETNYPDIVFINNTCQGKGKIHLKAMHHGRALIRISIDGNPHKSDYMMISVGAYLYPHNPVIDVGRSLNFSIEGLNDPVSGRWLSANRSVISIDVLSGEAHALKEGTTEVVFEDTSLKLQTTVTVQSIDLVLVDSPTGTLTNVDFPTNGYEFTVKFRDTQSHKFETIGNRGVHFNCWVDPPFVGYATPRRNLDSGNSYCCFFPYSPEHMARSIPKLEAIRPDILVSISASLIEAENVMGSSRALFIGGFSVLGLDKDLMQLNLTPESNKSTITVVGNTGVEIHLLGRHKVQVSPIRRDDTGIGGRADYEVKVLRDERFKEKITIILPATGQRVEFVVHYEPTVQHMSWRFLQTIFISLGVILFIIIIPKIIKYVSDSTEQSSPAMQSTVALGTRDQNSYPGYAGEQSPRTPQPFIEYVRRTIDETPYYKRDARRRFNPQNTY